MLKRTDGQPDTLKQRCVAVTALAFELQRSQPSGISGRQICDAAALPDRQFCRQALDNADTWDYHDGLT